MTHVYSYLLHITGMIEPTGIELDQYKVEDNSYDYGLEESHVIIRYYFEASNGYLRV